MGQLTALMVLTTIVINHHQHLLLVEFSERTGSRHVSPDFWRRLSYELPDRLRSEPSQSVDVLHTLIDGYRHGAKLPEYWWAVGVAAPFLIRSHPDRFADFLIRSYEEQKGNPFYLRALHRAALVALHEGHPVSQRLLHVFEGMAPHAFEDAGKIANETRSVLPVDITEHHAILFHPDTLLPASVNRRGRHEVVAQLILPYYHLGEPAPLPVAIAASIYAPFFPGNNVQHEMRARMHLVRSLNHHLKSNPSLANDPFFRKSMQLLHRYGAPFVVTAADIIQDAATRLHEQYGAITELERHYFHNNLPADDVEARDYIRRAKSVFERTGLPEAYALYLASEALFGRKSTTLAEVLGNIYAERGYDGVFDSRSTLNELLEKSSKTGRDVEASLRYLVRARDFQNSSTAIRHIERSAKVASQVLSRRYRDPRTALRHAVMLAFSERLISPAEYDTLIHRVSALPLPQAFKEVSVLQERVHAHLQRPYFIFLGTDFRTHNTPKSAPEIALLHLIDVADRLIHKH